MFDENQTKMPWPFWVMAVFAAGIGVYGFVFAVSSRPPRPLEQVPQPLQ